MCAEEPIGAVAGDRHGVNAVGAKHVSLVVQRCREAPPVGVQEAGHIVDHEPEGLENIGSQVSTTHRLATRRNSAQPSPQPAQ